MLLLQNMGNEDRTDCNSVTTEPQAAFYVLKGKLLWGNWHQQYFLDMVTVCYTTNISAKMCLLA